MSLYQKYSDLTSGIDKARSERTQLEDRLAKLQDEISQVEQATLDLGQESIDSRDDAVHYLEDTQSRLTDTLSDLENKNAKMANTCDMLEERKMILRRTFHDYQRRFLEESREFRRQCKRLRQQARSAGLPNAFQSAFAVSLGGQDFAAPLIFDSIDDNDSNILELSQVVEDSISSRNSDEMESLLETYNDDVELMEKLQIYKSQKKELSCLQEKVKNVQQLQRQAENESCGASRRRDKLQGQLDRIMLDNSKMDLEIREMQRTTEEAKALAEAFSQRRLHAIEYCVVPASHLFLMFTETEAPSSSQNQPNVSNKPSRQSRQPMTNPYLKKRSYQHTEQKPSDRKDAFQTPRICPVTSSDAEPPHREKQRSSLNRRRRNQFGSSLLITGDALNEDTVEQEDSALVIPHPVREPQGSGRMRVCITPTPTPAQSKIQTMSKNQSDESINGDRHASNSITDGKERAAGDRCKREDDLIEGLKFPGYSSPIVFGPGSETSRPAVSMKSEREKVIELLLEEKDDEVDELLDFEGLKKH